MQFGMTKSFAQDVQSTTANDPLRTAAMDGAQQSTSVCDPHIHVATDNGVATTQQRPVMTSSLLTVESSNHHYPTTSTTSNNNPSHGRINVAPWSHQLDELEDDDEDVDHHAQLVDVPPPPPTTTSLDGKFIEPSHQERLSINQWSTREPVLTLANYQQQQQQQQKQEDHYSGPGRHRSDSRGSEATLINPNSGVVVRRQNHDPYPGPSSRQKGDPYPGPSSRHKGEDEQAAILEGGRVDPEPGRALEEFPTRRGDHRIEDIFPRKYY